MRPPTNLSPKTLFVVWIAALAMLLLSAGTAAGDEHDPNEIPPHPHALVLGVEETPTGITATGCVDVAANRSLRLDAHHAHLHTGAAGEALFTNTGHFAVPLAPFPFAPPASNCAELFELFGVEIVRGKSGNHG